MLDTYFEIASVSLSHGEILFFFSQKYIQNSMNIKYAKFRKKIVGPIFQNATTSGFLKNVYVLNILSTVWTTDIYIK